jgi:hypothetical protein
MADHIFQLHKKSWATLAPVRITSRPETLFIITLKVSASTSADGTSIRFLLGKSEKNKNVDNIENWGRLN